MNDTRAYEYVIIDSRSHEELSDPTYLAQAQRWARSYKQSGHDVRILHLTNAR